MTDKKENPVNLFLRNFLGSEVEIMLNLYHKVEQSNGNEILSEQNPLAMRGFVLNVDDEYVYLGETPNAITRFCKISSIVGGNLVKEVEEGEFDEILNNFRINGSAN